MHRLRTGWGNVVLGAFWLLLYTPRLVNDIHHHQPVWKLAFFAVMVVSAACWMLYGFGEWFTMPPVRRPKDHLK